MEDTTPTYAERIEALQNELNETERQKIEAERENERQHAALHDFKRRLKMRSPLSAEDETRAVDAVAKEKPLRIAAVRVAHPQGGSVLENSDAPETRGVLLAEGEEPPEGYFDLITATELYSQCYEDRLEMEGRRDRREARSAKLSRDLGSPEAFGSLDAEDVQALVENARGAMDRWKAEGARVSPELEKAVFETIKCKDVRALADLVLTMRPVAHPDGGTAYLVEARRFGEPLPSGEAVRICSARRWLGHVSDLAAIAEEFGPEGGGFFTDGDSGASTLAWHEGQCFRYADEA